MKVKSERLGAHGWMNGLLSFLLLFPMFLLDAQIQPPTFTNCTDIEVCSYGTKDDLVHADIQAEVVNHCVTNPGLYWTTHIDLHSDGSIDQTTTKSNASGEYPLGVHTVTFWAADGCGGVSSCKRVVTVKDCQKPTPICKAVTIELMPSSGLAEIMGTSMESGSSYDNQTDYIDLQVLLERVDHVAPGQDAPDADAAETVVVTCDDLPPVTMSPVVEVAVWVGDKAGNWEYCVTTITVEDWMGSCGSICFPMNLQCYISNEDLEPVSLVTVDVSSPNGTQSEITTSNGWVSVSPFSVGYHTITPHKDINPLNGLSAYDLYLMQRHLLGVKLLSSPYKLIAADINRNCEVSIADLLALRKMILDPVNAEFQNNVSWRFVDGTFSFPDPTHPCDFAETKIVEVASSNGVNVTNFIAVKIGDVSGDHTPNNLLDTDIRNKYEPLSFQVDDQLLIPGQEYTVEFVAHDFHKIEAYQYTLDFNTDLLEFVAVSPIWAELSEANFNISHTSEGVLSTSWNGSEPTALAEGEKLFTIKVRAKVNVQLSQALTLNSRLTPAVAYQHEGEEMDVQLHFTKGQTAIDAFELYQNEPNPFGDLTRIGFNIPEAGEATLTIHDVTGKVVYKTKGEFAPGYNAFVIRGSEVPVQGMMYYTVQSGEHMATMRMTKQK